MAMSSMRMMTAFASMSVRIVGLLHLDRQKFSVFRQHLEILILDLFTHWMTKTTAIDTARCIR